MLAAQLAQQAINRQQAAPIDGKPDEQGDIEELAQGEEVAPTLRPGDELMLGGPDGNAHDHD